MKSWANKLWTAFFAAASIVIAAGTIYVFSDHPLSSDEGVVLNAAWQLWNGKILYKDFVWYITPGTPEFVWIVWKLFGGASYGAAKLAGIGLLLLSAVSIGWAAKQFSRNRFAPLLTAVLWISSIKFYPVVNHNFLSSCIAVFAFAFMLKRASGKPSLKLAALTGLTVAATTALLQTKGGLLFIACLVLYLWWRAPRNEILTFVAAYTIPLALYLLRWSPITLFNALFIYPNQNYWGPNSFLNQHSILYTEIFILVALILLFITRPLPKFASPSFLVVIVFQIALWVSSVNIIDIQHMFVNIFPLCALAVVLLPTSFLFDETTAVIIFRIALVAGLFVGALMSDWRFTPHWNRSIFGVDFQGRKEVISETLVNGGITSLYAGPGLPGLYFEMGVKNPYPYAELTTPAPEAYVIMKDALQKEQPEHVVADYQDMIKWYHYSLDNPLDQYIGAHYRWCGNFPYTTLIVGTRTTCPVLTIKD